MPAIVRLPENPFFRKKVLFQAPSAIAAWDTRKSFGKRPLNEQLDGEVVSSVLGSGLLCRFVIYLPDGVMKKYVRGDREQI